MLSPLLRPQSDKEISVRETPSELPSALPLTAQPHVSDGIPAQPPRASVPPPPTALPEVWRSLLPVIDPSRQTISGNWRTSPEGLFSDNQICILKLADEMPESYDVRISFARLQGQYSIALIFKTPQGTGSIDIDGWGQGLSGVQTIDGRDLRHGNAFTHILENNRTYQLHVEIRPEAISISIDGVHKITTPIQGRTLGIASPFNWDPTERPAALAIGSYQSATLFSAIEWRQIP